MLLVNNDDEVSPNAKDSPQKKEKRFLWNHGGAMQLLMLCGSY